MAGLTFDHHPEGKYRTYGAAAGEQVGARNLQVVSIVDATQFVGYGFYFIAPHHGVVHHVRDDPRSILF